MLIEFFYPLVPFPPSFFTEVLGKGKVHYPCLPGACRAAEGEGEERLASGTITCRRRLQQNERDRPWVGPGVPAVNKDEALGGEDHIVQDTVETHPVRCQDDGFTALHGRTAHTTTHSPCVWDVLGIMLFSWTFGEGSVFCERVPAQVSADKEPALALVISLPVRSGKSQKPVPAGIRAVRVAAGAGDRCPHRNAPLPTPAHEPIYHTTHPSHLCGGRDGGNH